LGNLIIYQSSAGSGKTYTLAKEYLKLAFKYPGAFRHILAVTFTNKATAEMKNRIIEFLIALSANKDKDLKKQLVSEGVKIDIQSYSKLLLESILHDYSNFSVSTNDSFFNKVLRSFSKELKIQLGYQIDFDNITALDSVTDKLLGEVGTNEKLEKFMEDYIFSTMEDDKSWDVEKQIKNLGNEIFRERYWEKKFENTSGSQSLTDSRESLDDFISELDAIKKDFENKMKTFGDDAEKTMDLYSLVVEDFNYGYSGVMGYLIKNIRNNKQYIPGKRALSACEDYSNWYSKNSKKKSIINEALDSGLFKLLKSAVDFYDTEGIKYNTALEIKKTIYTVGIFEDLIRLLNEYRKDNRILLQSDISTILQSLISKEDSPFIFEKIGNSYRNFLIDEFQDTSSFHWKNFLPLIVNSLSEKNTSLIVGDVKQSIYRWRGGNMKLLLNQIYEDLSEFDELIETKNLNINRRSRKEIVEFNNIFFENAPSVLIDDIKDTEYEKLINNSYSKAKQEILKDKSEGFVNISFIQKDETEEQTKEDKVKEKLLETIKNNLDDDYKLRDILILVRRKVEANKIAGWLAEKEYEFVSSDSLMLENSPKVRTILNALRYIADNKNDISKILMMQNYLYPLQEFGEIFSGDKSREMFLKRMPGDFFKENEKPRLKPVLNDLTIFELSEQLVKIFKIDENPDPYIIKFQNVIYEYSQKGNTDLISFLDYWEDHKVEFSISVPEEIDAVKIMTIHTAKGLQSKVVIIPFANWKLVFDGTKDSIWVSSGNEPFNRASAYLVKATKSLTESYFKDDYMDEYVLTKLDNLNLLYVAFTRPEERLYVIVPDVADKNVSGLIKSVIEKTEILNENLKDNIFELGKKVKAVSEESKPEIKSSELKKYISQDWYKKITIKPKHKKLKVLMNKEFAFKTNWGNIIHETLSYIKTTDDAESAIDKVYYEGLITIEQKETLEKQIDKMLTDEKIIKWFSDEANIITETDILLKDGKILRPDRVVIENEKVTVIDYKTGIEKDEHIKQVNQYGEVLAQMGYKKIEKYLLYINETEFNYTLKEVM